MSANETHKDKLLKLAIHKVGEINNKSRIWIANKSILKSFGIGNLLNIDYDAENSEIVVNKANENENHNHKISSRENKKGKTPILDIKNLDVTKLFKDIEKVEVLYFHNKIVIRATKNEKARMQRKNKNGKNYFELFVSGGLLSHFFRKTGLIPKGGLEIEDKFLQMYEKNNKGEDIYTINSSIEDIHESDYPNDIDIVLAGIPCTFFTSANIVLTEALKALVNGTANDKQLELIKKKEDSDAIVYHVLNAIKAMNPKVLIIEEVVEFSKTESSMLLRSLLRQWKYNITETIDTGIHANRKRWCLVAHMDKKINLNDLVPEPTKTISEVLATPIEDRDWKEADDIPCLKRSMNDSRIGSRAKNPTVVMKANTFDTHGARASEPIMKHPTLEKYDKYTNDDILNIHGLQGYELSGEKSLDRKILGQGVCDMFYYVAKRIKESICSESIVKAVVETTNDLREVINKYEQYKDIEEYELCKLQDSTPSSSLDLNKSYSNEQLNVFSKGLLF